MTYSIDVSCIFGGSNVMAIPPDARRTLKCGPFNEELWKKDSYLQAS